MIDMVDKIRFQMSEFEMYERLFKGECPIDICIDKYKRFKEWCKYQIELYNFYDITWNSEINDSICALCYVNNKDCTTCVLSKIKAECCPDKAVISPWRRVRYACNYVDDSEERQQELYDAIDNMIITLEKCKEIEE